jgi:hypothetical protein
MFFVFKKHPIHSTFGEYGATSVQSVNFNYEIPELLIRCFADAGDVRQRRGLADSSHACVSYLFLRTRPTARAAHRMHDRSGASVPSTAPRTAGSHPLFLRNKTPIDSMHAFLEEK